MPGNPIDALFGPESQVSVVIEPEIRNQLKKYYQLEKPLYHQYFHYLSQTLRGRLGWGIYFCKPVGQLIKERISWSGLLIALSVIISLMVALPCSALSSLKRYQKLDSFLVIFFLFLSSTPIFLTAMILLVVFSVKLGWLPLAGAMSETFTHSTLFFKVKDILHHSLGPVLALSIAEAPSLFLISRSAMIKALDEPWMEFAFLRGLSKIRIIFAYLMPSGLLPVITRLGIHIAFLLAGTVFVETIFSYPGLGRLLFQAVELRDYPVMQGVFLVMTIVVLVINLFIDLSYQWIDPRAREIK